MSMLKGKVAIITGASQGLGLEITRAYLQAGASVAICAREEQALNTVCSTLFETFSCQSRMEAHVADVSDQHDVERFVAATLQRFGRIDILVNNAGIYGPMGAVETVDWEQWVKTLQVNVLGSVLMCRAVLPCMKANRKGKIIQLSGGGATRPMPNISAYAASKAAIVRFAETLAEEVREYGIDVNSIAPGALNTRMLEEVLMAGPEQVGQMYFNKAIQQKQDGGTPFEQPVELALFLASEKSNGITGKLISAVWDKWGDWLEHCDELGTSDVYTLRRITGRERGFSWGDQ